VKKGLVFLIIPLLMLSFSGCNNSAEEIISPTFEEFNSEIVPGGTVEAYMLRPDTLNPILTTIDVNKKMLNLCYDSLFYTDSRYNCVPFLAESYEYSSSGRKLTITLREGIKWHDGSDFTAGDVKYTINSILKNEDSPYNAFMTELIGGIKQNGENKITLTFNYSDSGAHNLLTFPIIKNGSVKEGSYTPVGTGAFIFNEIENQENYLLKKNENWAMGNIYIDEINVDEEWIEGVGEEYIGEAKTREEADQLIDDHLNGLI
jgi:peptide/nickel transport system substrate-binding protein